MRAMKRTFVAAVVAFACGYLSSVLQGQVSAAGKSTAAVLQLKDAAAAEGKAAAATTAGVVGGKATTSAVAGGVQGKPKGGGQQVPDSPGCI